MTEYIYPGLALIGVFALCIGTFWLGKQWTARKALVAPEMLAAAGLMVAEAMRLQRDDPTAQAKQDIAKATFEAHLTAIKALLSAP